MAARTPPQPRLVAHGIAARRVARALRHGAWAGAAIAEGPTLKEVREAVVFVPPAQNGTLAQALSAGARAYIETGEASLPADLDQWVEESDLLVLLQTGTAFPMPVAHTIAGALARRAQMTAAGQADLELALHEAYSNGLIHGNLELTRQEPATLPAYVAFSKNLERRLADPHYAHRTILIAARIRAEDITLTVQDEGPGYAAPARLPADARYVFGRGLDIIHRLSRSVEIDANGSRTILSFDRLKGAAPGGERHAH